MKNIELKVGLDDFRKVRSQLKSLGAKYQGKLCQVDTYFKSKNGRLKIREINNRLYELIFYQRPDQGESKVSNYQIIRISGNQLKIFKEVLRKSMGKKVVVRKERDLWKYKNTRIYLDKVDGLGNFLELETLVLKGINKSRKEYNEVVKFLDLSKHKKYKKSYSDMLINNK